MVGSFNICLARSPRTGKCCSMGRNHFGPHQVGGPYETVDEFVTRCTHGCTYHLNSRELGRHHTLTYLECFRCGHIIFDNRYVFHAALELPTENEIEGEVHLAETVRIQELLKTAARCNAAAPVTSDSDCL